MTNDDNVVQRFSPFLPFQEDKLVLHFKGMWTCNLNSDSVHSHSIQFLANPEFTCQLLEIIVTY